MIEPSQVLGLFKPSQRVAIGMAVYALADRLAGLSEDEMAAFGVVIAGQASGWMEAGEVPHDAPRHETDRLASELWRRIESAAQWEDELRDGDDG